MKRCTACDHSMDRHVEGLCLTGLQCPCGREGLPRRNQPKPAPAKSAGRAAKQYSDAQRKAKETADERSEW